MDLTTFRASHPGLYQEAIEKGADAERERCSDLGELAEAAGADVGTLRHAIDSGATPREVVAQFSRYASKSDDTAAAFVKKVDRMRLTVGCSSNDPEGDAAAAMIARMRGGSPSSSSSRSPRAGQQDNGDLVAAAMGLGMPAAAPSRSSNARQSQPLDDTDKVAAAMGLAAPAK